MGKTMNEETKEWRKNEKETKENGKSENQRNKNMVQNNGKQRVNSNIERKYCKDVIK